MHGCMDTWDRAIMQPCKIRIAEAGGLFLDMLTICFKITAMKNGSKI